MTRTNKKTGSTRIIRIAHPSGPSDASPGFDAFRVGFHKAASKDREAAVTVQSLLDSWPAMDAWRTDLAKATARKVLRDVDLLGRGKADLAEWCHYCALERDGCSDAARED